MKFNKHSEFNGTHAFLGASRHHWVRYSDDKIIQTYKNFEATLRGTKLHELASNLITYRVSLADNNKSLNSYVNDAIGFKMEPEVLLYYSENCFGTADAISFRNNFLRIHDLKTGSTKASIEQLLIYAALFCLEYKKNVDNIKCELRIYQSNKIHAFIPDSEEIKQIMEKIISADKILKKIQSGG